MRRWKTRTVVVTLAVFTTLAVVLLLVMRWSYDTRQRLYAKRTQSDMRVLWAMCEASQASSLDEVLIACRREKFPCRARDGWGNKYIVEIRSPSEKSRGCVIISMGRDHRRGRCCTSNVGWRWDEDAVLAAEWLQTWNYFESGRTQ